MSDRTVATDELFLAVAIEVGYPAELKHGRLRRLEVESLLQRVAANHVPNLDLVGPRRAFVTPALVSEAKDVGLLAGPVEVDRVRFLSGSRALGPIAPDPRGLLTDCELSRL